MSIYVEILIRAPMDAVWAHSQTPALHQRWDLRFSEIEYLPLARAGDAQRFRYATRIGFGLEVSGEGETLGQRHLPDGSASSALKFWSASPISIIREGSGYWKYIPTSDGIRFLTWYDYRTRFGGPGALFDRLIFRPLIGWATAWSFDRLRLWLEQGVAPSLALRQMLVHSVARITLACIFAYQGIVPKLVARHADEIAMIRDAGISPDAAGSIVALVGALEVLFALILLVASRRRWPAWFCLASMGIATLAVGVNSPRFFAHAFNPFVLNVAVAALAAIDLLVLENLPSAARCFRRPRQEN